MQSGASARWRSWLVLVISVLGGFSALGLSALLMFSGGLGLLENTGPASRSISVLNLSWGSALVALLCAPGAVFSIRELMGKPIPERAGRRNFILSSLALLIWVGLVFLFKPLETSRLAWLLLPPLVILATIIPLWWYLESGRRGLTSGSPAHTWGTISVSLMVTIPLILIIELVILLVIIAIATIFISSQPELARQVEAFALLFNDFNRNSELIQKMLGDLLSQPGVIAVTLAIAAGVIPFLEELFKPLAVWLLAGERLTPAQGFITGMWSGACFALYENLTALSAAGDGNGTVILLARVGTGLLHIVTAGLVGWGLASAWRDRKNLSRLVAAYLLAVFLHATWNAAGVTSGIAPLLPLPADAPTLFSGIGLTASITLFILIGLNLVLLFFINFRLRKEIAIQNNSESIPEPEMIASQSGKDIQ
jgi:hypothetical protein